MRRILLRSTLLLLLTPTALLASTPADNVILQRPSLGSGCPIGLSVQRRSPTELVNVQDAARHPGSQRIRLTLTSGLHPAIRHAELTVHASSPRPQVLLTGRSSSAPDIDRTFQLTGPRGNGLHQRDLWIEDVGSILSVDLTAITYADGSTWHPSPNSTCRAVPDGLLLVSTP